MVGNGVDAQDLPGYAGHNDVGTAALLAAMARAGVDRLVLASSMVVYGDGPLRLPRSTATSHRPAPARRTSPPACSTRAARVATVPSLGWALVAEDTPFRPRTQLRGVEGRSGALRRRVVHAAGRTGDRPALPQRLRAGHAREHPVRRRRGDLPLGAGARRGPAGVRGRRQMRDFVHVDDVALANVAGDRAGGGPSAPA